MQSLCALQHTAKILSIAETEAPDLAALAQLAFECAHLVGRKADYFVMLTGGCAYAACCA